MQNRSFLAFFVGSASQAGLLKPQTDRQTGCDLLIKDTLAV